MPNQNNYRTDLTTITESRFTTSRIINVPDDLILYQETPASFGYNKENNIEVHFYSTTGNTLLLSTVINLTDNIIQSHIVSFNDGTNKNYIKIDFTKLFESKDLILIPGDYRMVLNFFSNEIGSYNNKNLNIDVISDSRTEVQLSFNDVIDDVSFDRNLFLLQEFIEKSLIKQDAIKIAEKIFKNGVESNDSEEGLTAQNIQENITLTSPTVIQTEETTLDRIDSLGLRSLFDQQLNNFLLELFKFIQQEIVINDNKKIKQSDFEDIIQRVVQLKIQELNKVVDSRIRVS